MEKQKNSSIGVIAMMGMLAGISVFSFFSINYFHQALVGYERYVDLNSTISYFASNDSTLILIYMVSLILGIMAIPLAIVSLVLVVRARQRLPLATPTPNLIAAKKFCSACGQEIPVGQVYCAKCGAKQ